MRDTIFKRNLNKKKNWLYLKPHLKAFPVSMFLKLAGYIY